MATQVVELSGDEAALLRSLQKVIDKEREHERQLGRMADAGDAAGLGIEKSMGRVEAANAKAIKSLIGDLGKLSPEAAKAANNIRNEMSLADRQVKFDNIVAELRKVDPAAADEGAKLRGTLQQSADAGAMSWKKFATSTIAQIGAVAGAYVGISQGVQLVNGYLEDQEALLDKSLQKQLSLAKAQQEAIKNLSAMTMVQQNKILQESVPQIASSAGFSDTVAITGALSDSVSAGGTEQQAISAVQNAALLNRLTPDKLGATASAAIDFAKKTGNDDARANLALLATTGTQSRIEDPKQLAANLAPALGAAVGSVPNQDKIEATKEAAALFSVFTQAATDKDGTSSKTATLNFSKELAAFFTGLERQQIEARSKIELLDRKIGQGSDTEVDRADKTILEGFLRDAKGASDPATLFGRIESLQQNEGLKDQFFSREFGEAGFKDAFKALADESSAIAIQIRESKGKIEVGESGLITF